MDIITPVLNEENARKFEEMVDKNLEKGISDEEFKKAYDIYKRYKWNIT